MSDVIVFDFQVIIHACAHKVSEYKQRLLLEAEVTFSLQNSNHLSTLFLTSVTFKPVFCATIPVGGVTAGILSFSKDLKAIL